MMTSHAVEREAVIERTGDPRRVYHVCAKACVPGTCGPGCVSYCGKSYADGGRGSRSSKGVPMMEICVICLGLRAGES